MCVVTSISLKIFGSKMRLFEVFKNLSFLRHYLLLFLRLKFHATSPFSVSSESGLIYETTPLFVNSWLLGCNKSPSKPDVQLNCNRHSAPQIGDDIVESEIYLNLLCSTNVRRPRHLLWMDFLTVSRRSGIKNLFRVKETFYIFKILD